MREATRGSRKLFLVGLIILFLFSLFPQNSSVHSLQDSTQYSPQDSAALAELPEAGFWNRSISGTTKHLGNGVWQYTSYAGELNTWNGSHYVPYLWNQTERTVTYAGHTLEFYDWYTVLKNSSLTVVDDIRWTLEYWNEGPQQWALIDLYSHSYLPAILNEDSMSFGYSMTDGSNTMNITMFFDNNDEVKTQLDINVTTTQTYRVRWQLTGMNQDPAILYSDIDSDGDGTNDLIGAVFANEINFMLADVNQSELDCWYDWTGAQSKLDFYIGNITINAGEVLTIDPTYSVSADTDDAYYDRGSDFQSFTLYTGTAFVWLGTSTNRVGIIRITVNIATEQEILSATLSLWNDNLADDTGLELLVRRVAGTDMTTAPESLSSAPANDTTYTETFTTDGTTNNDWENITVTRLVQDQIDEDGWSSGNRMGLKVHEDAAASEVYGFTDYSGGAAESARITVTYQADTTEDRVDKISDLHEPSDKGSQTDFSAMQQGPDAINNTMTESGVGDTVPTIHNDWTVTDSGGGTVSQLTLTKPAGASTDDLLLIIIGSDDYSSDPYFHDEDGWTRLEEETTSDNCHIAVFYRIADGSEGSTVTIDADDGDEQYGWYMRISGVNVDNPINAYNFESHTSTTDVSEITTTIPYTLVLYGIAFDGGDGAPFTNETSPWMEIDEQTSGTGPNDACGVWGYREMTSTGGTTAVQVGASITDGVSAFQLAINSVPANYELDIEVAWTTADYDEDNEELCIYAGPQDAEALKVDVWSGAAWVNVISDLAANSWNNVSVSSYLTDATFEIRFLHADNSSDTTKSEWEINYVLLHTYEGGAQQLSITVYELIDISDSSIPAADYHLTVNELIALSESVSVGLVYLIVISEVISLAAFASTTLNAGVNVFENIGLAASATTSVNLTTTINEIIELAFSAQTSVSLHVTLYEEIPLFDSTDAIGISTVLINEVIDFSSVVSGAANYATSINEIIDFSDSVSTVFNGSVTINEVIDLFDSVATSLGGEYSIIVYELIDLSGTVSTVLDASVTISESIGLVESVLPAFGAYVPISESLPLADSIASVLDASVLVQEILSLSDTTTTAISLFVTVFETIPFLDSVEALVNPTPLFTVIIYEIIPIVSSVGVDGGLQDVNILYELFFSANAWSYIGPMAIVTLGYFISKKDTFLGVLWFIFECLFMAHYLDLIEAHPPYWWHVMILLLGGLFTCVYPLWDRRR